MSELSCPVCKGDSYLNPNIKIYISPCFHRLCETCLYKIFQYGHAPCPECGTLLRRINFINSTFEDVEVERELKMRKLMNRYFQREECEFDDEVEYNDYLEKYETLLFDLLDLKNESQARDMINQIRSSENILIPKSMKPDPSMIEMDVKKLKTEDNWCLYVEEMKSNIMINDDEVIFPDGFILPFDPAGLKKKDVVDFFVYSFLQIIK